MSKEYFNTDDLVARYNLKSKSTLGRWVKEGKFPPVATVTKRNKRFLWKVLDVEAWERSHGGDAVKFRVVAFSPKELFFQIYPTGSVAKEYRINEDSESNPDEKIKSIAEVIKESGLAGSDGDNSTLDFTQDLAEPLNESEANDDEAVNIFAFESRINLIEQKINALMKSIMTLSQYIRSGAMMKLSEAKNVKLPILQFVLQDDEPGQCEGTDD